MRLFASVPGAVGRASPLLLLYCIVLSAAWCGCRTPAELAETPPSVVEVQSKWPYDREILTAIQQRWYVLLERRPTPKGKVVVEFKLRADGKVDGLKVTEHTVGELFVLFCQKAIMDPSPFRPWPQEMKEELKSDVREIRFTFFYNLPVQSNAVTRKK